MESKKPLMSEVNVKQVSEGLYLDHSEALPLSQVSESVNFKNPLSDRYSTAHNEIEYNPLNASSQLDAPQQPPPPPLRTKNPSAIHWWMFDWWGVEVLSCVLGIGSVVALCVLLRHYDGKPLPELGTILGEQVTLNAIIALLGLVARASLMIPIVECLSQLKWSYYKRTQKPLVDLLHFDTASRGPWGSFMLLWRLRFAHLAVLGAFLTIIALAIDPFIQQSVQFRTAPQEDHLDTQSSARFVSQWSDQAAQASYYPSRQTVGDIYSGILSWNDTRGDLTTVAPICSSGNCTWDRYPSIGVCSRMANVSDHLSLQDFVWNVSSPSWQSPFRRASLPGGQYFDFIMAYTGNGGFNMNATSALTNSVNWTQAKSQSLSFPEVQYPIADVYLIWYNSLYNSSDDEYSDQSLTNRSIPLSDQFLAAEIMLEWCVQTYDTSVVSGHANTSLSSSPLPYTPFEFKPGTHPDVLYDGLLVSRFDPPSDSHGPTLAQAWAGNVRGSNASDAADFTFSVEFGTHYGLREIFNDLLTGSVLYPGGSPAAPKLPSPDSGYIINDAVRALSTAALGYTRVNDAPAQHLADWPVRLQRLMVNVGVAMANRMRSASSEEIRGHVMRPVTVVDVQWKWLGLLFVFVAVTLLFFVATAVHERHSTVWKSSALAVLHALDPQVQRQLGAAGSASGMERQAQGIRLMLEEKDGGWRLT